MATIAPLDKRNIMFTFPNELPSEVSALDKRFLEDLKFLPYKTFPVNVAGNAATVQEWVQEVKIICYDLENLLQLRHEKFWVQIIHEKSVHDLLSSFLQKAPRSWDVWKLPMEHEELHHKLSKLIFLTIVRMSTERESKEDFLTPQGFGFAIYENFMFDIPKLFDICSIFGEPYGGNGPLVQRMLTNIFTKQNLYVDDLKTVVKYIFKEVFPNVITNFKSLQTLNGLYDLLYYHYDTVASLFCFFSTYPAGLSFFDHQELISQLGSLFQCLFSNIKEKVSKLSRPETDLSSLKTLVVRSELTTVRLINCIILRVCRMSDLENSTLTPEEHTEIAETFISVLSLVLDDKKLMNIYYNDCNLPKTFALIKNSRATVGQESFDYIMHAIDIQHSAVDEVEKCDNVESVLDVSTTLKASAPPDVDVHELKGIFPQHTTDVLRKCLEFYNFNKNEVIDALLENNLPPAILKLTEDIPSSSTGSSAPLPPPSSVLASRQNVFDNDEFDVFNRDTRDINFTRIHLGKQTERAFRDPSDTQDFLERHEKFRYEYDEYEDEYDDTYDGLAGVVDGEAEEEDTFIVRPLNTTGVQKPETDHDKEGPSDRDRQFRGGQVRGGQTSGKGKHPIKKEKPDDRTLFQRNRNERNKGQRANHNRRAGADRKRRGGMIGL